jgi:hypothetical protein
MPIPSLKTFISLPPGVLSSAKVRGLFQVVFEEYRWFRPIRYGFASPEEQVESMDALLGYYEEYKAITVAARTDRDYILLAPATPAAPPHVGRLIWVTSAKEATKDSWRDEHLRQVSALMRMLCAPLAQAGLDEEFRRKTRRLVPCADGFGREQVFTVRDPSEGLAGLFWRNFYGPPFTRLFGERLASLPADTRQDLGGGITLVQPYALPSEAGTPEGDARERELIAHLGPECFYDHSRHLKPTRLPELAR